MYTTKVLPGKKLPTPESASLFGILPYKKEDEEEVSSVVCLGGFFQGSLSMNPASFSYRKVKESDVLFYQARLHPEQDLEYYKRYFEVFCAPLLPSRIGPEIVNIYIPTEMEWKSYFDKAKGKLSDGTRIFMYNGSANGLDRGRTAQEEQAQKIVFFGENSKPFYRVEFNGTILGPDLYLLVSMLRAPYENYEMIDALFRAKDAGLNLSQCWFYATAYCTWWYHQFIEQDTIQRADLTKLPAFNLQEWIEAVLGRTAFPLFQGGKQSYIWQQLNNHLDEMKYSSKNKRLSFEEDFPYTYDAEVAASQFVRYSDGTYDNTIFKNTRSKGEKFLKECIKYNAADQ